MYFDQWRLNRWSMATLAIPEIFRCPRGSGQFSTRTECRRVTYQTSWFYKTWSVQASLRIYDHICHPGDVPVPPGKWPILDKNRNPSCDISNFMILENLACKEKTNRVRRHIFLDKAYAVKRMLRMRCKRDSQSFQSGSGGLDIFNFPGHRVGLEHHLGTTWLTSFWGVFVGQIVWNSAIRCTFIRRILLPILSPIGVRFSWVMKWIKITGIESKTLSFCLSHNIQICTCISDW